MMPPESSRLRVVLGFAMSIAVLLLVAMVSRWNSAGNGPTAVARTSDDPIPAMTELVMRQMDAHEFSMALATVQKILEIDPQNEYAIAVRPMIGDRVAQFAGDAPTSQHAGDREAALRAKLDRKLPELKFDAVPLEEMLLFLEQISGANLQVKWSVIDAAGLDRKTPITARLRDVKLSKALDILLRDAGGGKVRLGYALDDAVLTISTADDLAGNVVTSVYDIRDLVAVGATSGAAQQQLIKEIIKLIEGTVASASWKTNGGSSGTIRELQGQLIIVQTKENQNSIANLLTQLRETRAIQVTVESKVLSITDEKLAAIVPPEAAAEAQLAAGATSRPGAVATFLNGASVKPPLGIQFLDDEMVRSLTDASGDTLSVPKLTLFNGSSTATSVQSDAGTISLWLQATISSDRKFVTLTVSAEAKRDGSESPKRAYTFSMPDGASALLKVESDSADKAASRWIIIKPAIIIQREAAPQQFPIVNQR